jgi:hypothetical protein
VAGWPDAILVEYLGPPGLAVFGPPPFEAVRTERYLYVEYAGGGRELYDLVRDRYELDNLAGRQASRVTQAQLARTLQGLLES